MKDRLQELLQHEQMSPSRFADHIGVQRSSVSHVISGRNNPSFDFLTKTLKAFPGLRADWLLTGKGDMFTDQAERDLSLFGPDAPGENQLPAPEAFSQTESEPDEATAYHTPKSEITKKISRVLIFYDDATFSTHYPAGES